MALGKSVGFAYAGRVVRTITTLWPTRAIGATAAILVSVVAALIGAVVVRHAEWADRIDARVARGKKPRLEDFIEEGQWQAALVSSVVCLALAMTARYWMAGVAIVERADGGPRSGQRSVRWFWPVVLLCLIGAAWLRAPRLTHSLYNDEEYAFRRYVAGEHKLREDGGREWRPVSWLGTLWGNQMANNSVPYSLVSRAAYDWAVAQGWAAATLPAEVPLRLPAFLAGLGSVGVVALLARRLAGPAAGVVAGALAAVHPWHVRYSTEARGHSFILLLAPLLPLLLDRAVESDRWRWWALFGLVEVLTLWSFAGALHFLVAFNFLALIWLWRRPGAAWRRFLAIQAMAAVVYCHLMAPCFPQMRAALAANEVFSSGVSRSWYANTGSFLLGGLPWPNANPELSDHPSMQALWGEYPWTMAALAVGMMGVIGLGVGRVWRDPIGRLVTLSLPLAAGLAITASMVSGAVLFSWYVLYLLPGGLVLAAAGLVTVVESRAAGVPWQPLARWGFIGILLAGWIWMIRAPLATYRSMGKQALREVATFLRQPVDGVAPLAALHRSEAIAYDPSLIVIDDDPASLRALTDRADAEARPLVVAVGYRSLVAQSSPAFLNAIEHSGEFERLNYFPGLEETQFAHQVWLRRPRAGERAR
ncbi:MAG: glycosyltransferase family 39 protein [Verrucomicrobiales bacterium]